MVETAPRLPVWRLKSWLTWWRVAGFSGLFYAVGSAAITLSPSKEFFRTRFRVGHIAAYFDERASVVLYTSYSEAILAGVFLLVFATGLRSYLSRAEGGYSMWSHLVLAAGGVAAAVTLVVQPFAETLALVGAAAIDEPLLHAGIWFGELVRSTIAIPLATMVLSASVVDLKTRIFGGTVGILGALAASSAFLGAAWPLTGTTLSVFGFLLVFGNVLTLTWFAVVGVKLIAVKRPPLHMPGEGLFDRSPIIEGWTNQRST